MAPSVAHTIKSLTREHLEQRGGLLFGQAVTAVGWVNNTVPDCPGIVEFPMSDVSNMGIACGAALAGVRPIIVVRFQDFMWLNGSPLVNYAAKAREIFNQPVPVFVRALAQEHAGCTHSGVLHGLFMHMPGIRICCPMTSGEYREIWADFLAHDDPVYVSEHRTSFAFEGEFETTDHPADVTLVGISAARFNLAGAVERLAGRGVTCNVAHVHRLKPLRIDHAIRALDRSRLGLVVDAGYTTCGASQSVAYQLMLACGKPVHALGLEDRSVGVGPAHRNPTPSAERIAQTVLTLLKAPASFDRFDSDASLEVAP